MVPSKLKCKNPYLVDCSTSAACSTASTRHREPSPIASAASRISLRSPAAAKHAHLPAREPAHLAASLHAIPAATAISLAANRHPDRAADTPPPSAAAGQRRQFPSRPLPFPKPAWSETAGCPIRKRIPKSLPRMNRPQRLQIAFLIRSNLHLSDYQLLTTDNVPLKSSPPR